MIRIVTDSSCDLPPDLVEQHGISIVPLTIRFGTEEYVDWVGLSSDDFWRKLSSSDVLPETAAPSAGAFAEEFERLLAEGAEGIVTVCISGQLSATYQSAVIAAEKVGGPIKVLDSRSVSMGLGLPVLQAATTASRGASLDEVIGEAVGSVDSSRLVAALDTLEFLKRGGRIGGAQAFLGDLLAVKPLIAIEDGAVEAAGRVRTRSKAKVTLIGQVQKWADRIRQVAVLHTGTHDVTSFADAVAAVAGQDPIVARLGPVVGTHSGPGTIGVSYLLD